LLSLIFEKKLQEYESEKQRLRGRKKSELGREGDDSDEREEGGKRVEIGRLFLLSDFNLRRGRMLYIVIYN